MKNAGVKKPKAFEFLCANRLGVLWFKFSDFSGKEAKIIEGTAAGLF